GGGGAEGGGEGGGVGGALEGDARQRDRARAAGGEQGGKLRLVLGGPRDQHALLRQSAHRFGAGSPPAWARAASRSGPAPAASSFAATWAPSSSGCAPR